MHTRCAWPGAVTHHSPPPPLLLSAANLLRELSEG
jgi:hypothetical protein